MSLKPLLEAVSSELILVDTKGVIIDDIKELVKEHTDKIYTFTWCNDFSAARNFCLEHTCGEWFMFLDDDEVFDDVQELIDFFQSGECERFGSGYYYVNDHLNNGVSKKKNCGSHHSKDTEYSICRKGA